MSLLAPFLERVAEAPDKAAIIARDGAAVTYAELADWSGDLARRYRGAGLGAGDRVLVAVPVSPLLYAVLIALWRLGATAVFPEPSAGLAGLRLAAAATRPKALVAPAWLRLLCRLLPGLRATPLFLDLARREAPEERPPLEAVDPEQPALVSFTSGSTGRPKGIARSHAFLLAQQACLAPLLEPRAHDIDLVWFPAFVLSGLAFGSTSVLPDADLRRPAAVDARRLTAQLQRHGVTRILMPPAVCARLAGEGGTVRLRSVFTGGGPVFPDLLGRLADWAPGAEVQAVYGSTEAEPIAHVAVSEIAAADWKAMADGAGLLAGRPIPEAEVEILDDEILVAGDHVNKGYLDPTDDRDTKLRRDGKLWHRTGDAGRLDAMGRLWLLGRLEARVGRCFPFAVELAALSWPGVHQAALIGLNGEAVLAVAGDERQRPEWERRIAALGVADLRALPAIPLDKRHNSKVDYPRLKRLLAG